MRRLLQLVTALMFLELFFFAVLSPLLPGIKHELGVGTAAVGVLVAMYAFGALAGALPAVFVVMRVGARTTALASLLTFAAMSALFGLAHSYPELLASRFAQGIAGAACWTAAMVWLLESAPRDRRGAWLGYAFGVSEAGAIAGPAAGGVAAAAGRPVTFLVVGAACLGLAAVTSSFPAPPRTERGGLSLRAMLHARDVRIAMGIAVLPAVVLAAIGVLAPLQQHHLGAGSGEIAITFGLAAIIGILVRPLFGRWSDRRGPHTPIMVALLASTPIVLAVPWSDDRWLVAVLVIASLVVSGVLWAPLMVMLSDACVAAGVGQVAAVAVMDLTWPPGNAVGASGGAAVAQAVGQRWAYAAIAAALLVGALGLARARPATVPPTGTAEAPATSRQA